MHERDVTELNQLAYRYAAAPIQAMIDGLSAEHSAYKTLPLLGGSNAGYLQETMRNVRPVVRDYTSNRVLQKAYVKGERPVVPGTAMGTGR